MPRTILAATLLVLGCGACGSPTRPDPRVPQPIGTPTSLLMQPCEYLDPTARCPVDAIWGELYRSTRNVTTVANWGSDTPSVLRIVNRYVLQAVSPGTSTVTVEYEGRTLSTKFRVLDSGGPPWRVLNGEFHVQVRDGGGESLDGVLVELLTGGNAGLAAVSDREGRAIFVGEHSCGPVTARATRSGYTAWTGSATLCGRGGNGNWGSETLGPVVMTPSSSVSQEISHTLLLR